VVLISYSDVFAEDTHLQGDIPIATQWMIDAAGPAGRAAINSVFLIYGKKSQTKGTGFLIEDKQIITNNHVIGGNELEDIIVFSSRREKIPVIAINRDSDRDLAALKIDRQLHGWLELAPSSNIPIGLSVTTWGYPLGYNGPAPILAVGFLAGFNDRKVDNGVVRHLIVNGAFNPGNSGGPLLD
jgi:S1-C subfamily serine protease